MAKAKNNEVEEFQGGDYKFFTRESEKIDGVRVLSASQITDPDPNQSGSIVLDHALVVPFPAGRITEVYGPNGSCKTTLVLEVAGQALKAGKAVLYVNMERNLNRSLVSTVRAIRPFMEAQGKDPNCPFKIATAPNGEVAFQLMQKFAQQFPNGVVILDSIDASQPEAVMSSDIGENKVGNLAKLMSDACRKLITALEDNNVTCVMVNQTRSKIIAYGDPRTTSGGDAVPFYASQRIELMKPGKQQKLYNDDNDQIGVTIRFKIVKNKCAPDGIEGEFPILYGHGIWREKEVIQKGLEFGVLRFGGRGGKQVVLPKLDRETGQPKLDEKEEPEVLTMKQSLAWQRLLIDNQLSNWIEDQVRGLMEPDHYNVIDAMFEDEVQDA
jgi:recombination protein RecA